MTTDSGRVVAGDGGRTRPRRAKQDGDPFAELWEKANRDTDQADEEPGEAPPASERARHDAGSGDETTTLPTATTDEGNVAPATDEDEESEAPGGDRADRRAGRRGLRRERETVPIKARQVHRLVRRVDAWSVLKVSLLFYLSVWLIGLLAGTILWQIASSTETIDNVETFVKELFGLEVFKFNGSQIFRASVVGGLVAVVFGSAFTALLAILFNLIADLTGGVRLTVLEVARARPTAVPSGDADPGA